MSHGRLGPTGTPLNGISRPRGTAPSRRSVAAARPKPRASEPAVDRSLEPVVVGLAPRPVDSTTKIVWCLRPLVTDVVPADLPESAERSIAHAAIIRP